MVCTRNTSTPPRAKSTRKQQPKSQPPRLIKTLPSKKQPKAQPKEDLALVDTPQKRALWAMYSGPFKLAPAGRNIVACYQM